MNELRDRPYSQFTFLVHFGTDNRRRPDASFQEISLVGLQANHSAPGDSSPVKITGSYKVNDVTLKRGLIGNLETLYSWLQQVTEKSPSAAREVSITLLDENRQPATVWKLHGARPKKYTGPPLSGKGTDVAIEELVLACESIEVA